jgi:hypothetical protein
VTPEVVGQKQSEVFYSAFKNGSPHYSITTLFFSLVRLGQNHPGRRRVSKNACGTPRREKRRR